MSKTTKPAARQDDGAVCMSADDFARTVKAVQAREAATRRAELAVQEAKAAVLRAVCDEQDVFTAVRERYPHFTPGTVDYRPDAARRAWVPVPATKTPPNGA